MSTVAVEKRKYIRLEYIIPVTLKFCGATELTCQALCNNVSFGGMGLQINTGTLEKNIDVKPETPVSANIELPQTAQSLTVYGLVRWSRIDEPTGKLFLGIEFCTDKHRDTACLLFHHAQKQIKRRKCARGWFVISFIAMAVLSIWGVELHMQNVQLVGRINQLTSLSVEMESRLLDMRDIKFSTEAALQKAYKENVSLSETLKILEYKTELIKTSIAAMEQRVESAETENAEKNTELVQAIQEKSMLNQDLFNQISELSIQLAENEKTVSQLQETYEEHSRAFYNRFTAKQKLDRDIKRLAAQAGTAANIAPPGYADLPRGMWVDNSELFKFPNKSDALLAFCAARNINLLFARVDLDNPVLESQYPEFIRKAHERKIEVHAFFRHVYPGAQKNYTAAKTWAARVIAFNKNNEHRFDGINVELVLENSSGDSAIQYTPYLTFFESMVAGRNDSGSALDIGATLVYAKNSGVGDSAPFVYNGRSAFLSFHLIDTLDYLAIAVSDTSNGAHEEIGYAGQMNKKVYVGQQFSFTEDSYDASLSGHYVHLMEQQIKDVVEEYLDMPAFVGIAISSYALYARCIEDNTPEYIKQNRDRIISVQPPRIDFRSPLRGR